MDKHFLQLVGTAMGIKAAPPYANFSMRRHKETIREVFICTILFWKRFIDNIFLIFLGTTNQLQSLQDFMNHLHPTIKFTFQHSTQQISFLNIKYTLEQTANYPQNCTENPLTARHFYTFTPTIHSSVKKALFFHKP